MATKKNEDTAELRAFVTIDRMQPQFAALAGSVARGDPPVAGMAQLYVEIAPGNHVFHITDVALKTAEVRPGSMVVEREFGFLEVHSRSQDDVSMAGSVILDALGLDEADRVLPEITSTRIITNVDPYQAQLVNRFRRGGLLVPSESLLVMEVAPAAYVMLACNEAEKAADIKMIEVSPVGRFGRMFVSGSEAETRAAMSAAVAALESLRGKGVV